MKIQTVEKKNKTVEMDRKIIDINNCYQNMAKVFKTIKKLAIIIMINIHSNEDKLIEKQKQNVTEKQKQTDQRRTEDIFTQTKAQCHRIT